MTSTYESTAEQAYLQEAIGSAAEDALVFVAYKRAKRFNASATVTSLHLMAAHLRANNKKPSVVERWVRNLGTFFHM